MPEPEPEGNGHDLVAMVAILLRTRLGRSVPMEEAQAVIAFNLASATRAVDNPAAYMRRIINDGNPAEFMPRTADDPEPKPAKRHGPHCGECDPHTRMVELPNGRMQRCRNCHALGRQLLPQHARCDGCRAVIYRQDRGLPCTGKGHHRVVEEWQAAYDAAVEAARIAREAEAAAKAEARARGEHVPEPDHGPDWDSTFGLHGEELARAQLAQARAARLPERVNAAAPAELESGQPADNPQTAPDEAMPDINPHTGQPWPF